MEKAKFVFEIKARISDHAKLEMYNKLQKYRDSGK